VLDWLDNTDMQVVWPVHPGTTVQGIAASFSHPRLVKDDPMDYWDFIEAMRSSRFLITDSGGVQEEATALGKYTIVVRHETERPEAVLEGSAHLTPPNRARVREALGYAEMGWNTVSPSDAFGDGKAAKHIMSHLMERLGR
jgi:UDP-N-acetylglucosamine 2-epimerase (non-hydrolysing)